MQNKLTTIAIVSFFALLAGCATKSDGNLSGVTAAIASELKSASSQQETADSSATICGTCLQELYDLGACQPRANQRADLLVRGTKVGDCFILEITNGSGAILMQRSVAAKSRSYAENKARQYTWDFAKAYKRQEEAAKSSAAESGP